MKLYNYINILASVLALSACASKPDNDFKPYLMDAQQEQTAQYRRESWQVADWAANQQAGAEQIDAFFRSGVLMEYDKGGWGADQTLVVGPEFYHLSGYDQRRVLDLFNHLYNVTTPDKKKKETVLSLKDWHTGRIIGIYTRSGLQLS